MGHTESSVSTTWLSSFLLDANKLNEYNCVISGDKVSEHAVSDMCLFRPNLVLEPKAANNNGCKIQSWNKWVQNVN